MRAREVALYLEQVCAHKLYQFGCISVPTDLGHLAKAMNAQIQYEDMHHEGSVERRESGYLIRVKADAPVVRQRFSIAHEIGHLLIDRLLFEKESPDYKRFRHYACVAEGLGEENLANQIAGILLLPAWFVQSRIGDQPSINAVRKIAREANVSLSTALIRVVHLASSPCVAFMAREVGCQPPRMMWYWNSESIDGSSVRKDLSDEVVVETLTRGGFARDESLQLDWNQCDAVRRTFDGVTTWHCLASVSTPNRSETRTHGRFMQVAQS